MKNTARNSKCQSGTELDGDKIEKAAFEIIEAIGMIRNTKKDSWTS